MMILKCPVCGGDVDINPEKSMGICQFCDAQFLIPKEFEKKEKLNNRAVFLRMNGEFDKAAEKYEELLTMDNHDVNAHWGLALCRHGIEYVLDPRTKTYIPTCSQIQETPITADMEYKAAVELSEGEPRRFIQEEAEKIADIQRKIMEIARKEPPYDVFISYKELDENQERTEDSVLAQEIYERLVKRGYRVFFARKTLKPGSEYEPVIYSALRSAKVMVVVGTKPEHVNAVWVRNEWNRYLKMVAAGDEKTIIPVYKGFSPYALPDELSNFTALDMTMIGFIQELTDGIERCLKSSPAPAAKPIPSAARNDEKERLNIAAETLMMLGNYPEAARVYQEIQRRYPDDYRGWWGFIRSDTKDFSKLEFQPFYSTYFNNVGRLAPAKKYDGMRAQFMLFCKKTAPAYVEKDMKQIDEKVRLLNDHRQHIQDQIQTEKDRLVEYQKQLDKGLEDIKWKIACAKRSLVDRKIGVEKGFLSWIQGTAMILLGFLGRAFSILMICVGVYGILMRGEAAAGGVLIASFACVAHIGKKINEKGQSIRENGTKTKTSRRAIQKELHALESELQERLRENEEKMKEAETLVESNVQRLEGELHHENGMLERINFLANMEEKKYNDLCFARLCTKSGIEVPANAQDERMWNEAFEALQMLDK